MRHIGIFCVVDDPFDPPGHGRFGGGHVFMFDLGRYLVRAGFRVTYVTRLNSANKSKCDLLGPQCTVIRIPAGPEIDVEPETTGYYIDSMTQAAEEHFERVGWPEIVHAQYWVSGEIARRLSQRSRFMLLFHPLSFGREKRAMANAVDGVAASHRESIEPAVLNAADFIVTVTPHEKEVLRQYYPEVDNEKCVLVPHGVDVQSFTPRPDAASHYLCRQAGRFLQGTENVASGGLSPRRM